jgi:hypothetical protein
MIIFADGFTVHGETKLMLPSAIVGLLCPGENNCGHGNLIVMSKS